MRPTTFFLAVGLAIACLAGSAGVASATTHPPAIVEYSVPTANSAPAEITSGPDGNLWVIDRSGNKIGRITPSGVISEFPIPTSGSGPVGITTGPDGNLWFTEFSGNQIGQLQLSS